MGKLTWMGDGDPEAKSISMFGYVFAKGEPVDVTDEKLADKLATNPTFHEDDTEVEELRALLDELGVKYSRSAKAATLRAKLDEATKAAA